MAEPRRSIEEGEVRSLAEVEARIAYGARIQSLGYDRVLVIEPDVAPYTVKIAAPNG